MKTFHVEARKKGFVQCRFGFCDIQNSQGLSKGYQPQPTSTLIILDITKPSPNNCLMLILEKAIQGKLGPKDDLGPVDTPNINRVKIISLFCTAHRPVSILLLLQVWRWFSPVTEKEIIIYMAPFIVLLPLIVILIILPGFKGVCLESRPSPLGQYDHLKPKLSLCCRFERKRGRWTRFCICVLYSLWLHNKYIIKEKRIWIVEVLFF